MKSIVVSLAAALLASQAFALAAASPTPAGASGAPSRLVLPPESKASGAAGAQTSKMKSCNADARTRNVHGADRRAFMKRCLSGKSGGGEAS